MGWVCSTHVEIHFVSLLEREGFGQHMLRCIIFPRSLGGRFLITSSDTFCVLGGMGWVCSTHVEIQVESSLAWDWLVLFIFTLAKEGFVSRN